VRSVHVLAAEKNLLWNVSRVSILVQVVSKLEESGKLVKHSRPSVVVVILLEAVTTNVDVVLMQQNIKTLDWICCIIVSRLMS
jgi:hypothetical protein